MTVPGRGNGLVASSYVAMADVEPQLADQLLGELRVAGVAAYAAAVADGTVERLYVDRAAVPDAEAVLRRRLPDPPGSSTSLSSEDEAWAAIVAGWDEPPAIPVHGRIDGDEDASAVQTPEPPASPPAVPAEEHFVPPAPPPLPTADPVTRMAWIAVISGPVFFLLTALLRIEVTGLAAFLGVAAFVGGFVTLVARMRDRPDADGSDDGAVV
jgi:hypothetical protein